MKTIKIAALSAASLTMLVIGASGCNAKTDAGQGKAVAAVATAGIVKPKPPASQPADAATVDPTTQAPKTTSKYQRYENLASASGQPALDETTISGLATSLCPLDMGSMATVLKTGYEKDTLDNLALTIRAYCPDAYPSYKSARAALTAPKPKPKPAPTTQAAPAFTVSQEQAIDSAKSYLEMGGFSRAGLIDQLDSAAGEGFSEADAVFAVDHVTVDWNQQAVDSAKSYLSMGGYSRAGLLDQLTSAYGEQFTLAQATYAVNKLGL